MQSTKPHVDVTKQSDVGQLMSQIIEKSKSGTTKIKIEIEFSN